jgi:hypothetical protein
VVHLLELPLHDVGVSGSQASGIGGAFEVRGQKNEASALILTRKIEVK